MRLTGEAEFSGINVKRIPARLKNPADLLKGLPLIPDVFHDAGTDHRVKNIVLEGQFVRLRRNQLQPSIPILSVPPIGLYVATIGIKPQGTKPGDGMTAAAAEIKHFYALWRFKAARPLCKLQQEGYGVGYTQGPVFAVHPHFHFMG